MEQIVSSPFGYLCCGDGFCRKTGLYGGPLSTLVLHRPTARYRTCCIAIAAVWREYVQMLQLFAAPRFNQHSLQLLLVCVQVRLTVPAEHQDLHTW